MDSGWLLRGGTVVVVVGAPEARGLKAGCC